MKVTVNGKVAGSGLPHDAVLVLPPGFPRERIIATLEDAGIYVGSEWRDGTGTTTVLIPNPERQP